MSLLDDNLDSISNVSDKDLLADICLKYFKKYGEHGMNRDSYERGYGEYKLTAKYLYKNKHKQYKEIINNPEKFILCIKYDFKRHEKRLLILNEIDLHKNNTISPCWFYFNRDHSEYTFINKILNIMS